MKQRFYFQEFEPDRHKQLYRWHWQTAIGAGEYDVPKCAPGTAPEECVHTIREAIDCDVDFHSDSASRDRSTGFVSFAPTRSLPLPAADTADPAYRLLTPLTLRTASTRPLPLLSGHPGSLADARIRVSDFANGPCDWRSGLNSLTPACGNHSVGFKPIFLGGYN